MKTFTSPADQLLAARHLIGNPKRWTRKALARNKYGHAVKPTSPGAVRWCAIGALMAVAGVSDESTVGRADRMAHGFLVHANGRLTGTTLTYVNDFGVTLKGNGGAEAATQPETAHAAVIAAYDEALEAL